MKQLSVLIVTMILLFTAGNLFAGSVDALGNLSAEYIRTLSRNASTDADAVTYNPAGLAFMQDGLYVDLGGQYLIKDYRMKDEKAANTWNIGKEFKSDVPSIIPNLAAVYKSNDWAAFLSFNAIAGGGSLKYDGGSPMLGTAMYWGGMQTLMPGIVQQAMPTIVQEIMAANPGMSLEDATAAALPIAMQNAQPIADGLAKNAAAGVNNLKLESIYYAATIGGAYKFNDMFSGGLGFRYVYGSKTFDIKNKTSNAALTTLQVQGTNLAKIDLTAHGFTGIASVDCTPIEELFISLRYESPTILKWDTKISGSAFGGGLADGLGYKDGETERKDLPQIVAAGLSYRIIPDLTASLSFTYYMISQSNWKHYNGVKTNSEYSNGFDAAIALEYSIIPALLVSAGYMRTQTGGGSKTLNDFEMALDSNAFAIGARYEAIEGLFINLGLQWAKYIDANGKPDLGSPTGPENIKYSKDVKAIGLGVQYKIM